VWQRLKNSLFGKEGGVSCFLAIVATMHTVREDSATKERTKREGLSMGRPKRPKRLTCDIADQELMMGKGECLK